MSAFWMALRRMALRLTTTTKVFDDWRSCMGFLAVGGSATDRLTKIRLWDALLSIRLDRDLPSLPR